MAGSAVIQALAQWGPQHCEPMSEADARAWCSALARRQYENFSVLSALVPRGLEEDFAAVYAFCRWADDLGDEAGSPQRAAELLAWWRRELEACLAGEPRHPVFRALLPTVRRHDLPREPFVDLISAFEMDQTTTRYETWNQLLGYCRLSADPVGRLVLMLLGEPRTHELRHRSDLVCTALQLTNHWQDIRRDRLERDRIYIPRELNPIADFETRLEATARQGHAPDREFLAESRRLVRGLVERTWPLFEEGRGLLELVGPGSRPVIGLFVAGGEHVLASIQRWNYETVLHRPRLSKAVKLGLVGRAWLGARLARRRRGDRACGATEVSR